MVLSGLIRPMNRALRLLAEHPAPVIASVQGVAAGAGMSLALACDFIIASRSARFDFAYLKLAASCDLGISWHLPRLVGLRRALEIALLGEPLTAQDAQELGLVNWVVEDDRLELRTRLLAERFVNMPRPALGEVKRLMRRDAATLFGQLEQEEQAFARVMGSEAFTVAVSRFLSKRQPG
jgi:2-(1,2-epoxy-1,2-dihydrophenyl)acetyl-CoA isomerase